MELRADEAMLPADQEPTDEEPTDEEPLCVICLVAVLDRNRLVALVPCGHQNQCAECISVLMSRPDPGARRCAYCRQIIATTITPIVNF